MQFNNILVPVDLSVNTEVAIEKALSYLRGRTTIHLLHVIKTGWISMVREAYALRQQSQEGGDNHASVQETLSVVKSNIEHKIKDVNAIVWVEYGASVQQVIINKARQLHNDLIIIGKHSQHHWPTFSQEVASNEIAVATGIPVLTVRPGSVKQPVKDIVVPVTINDISKKIDWVQVLCQSQPLQIHLVTFLDDHNRPASFFSETLFDTLTRLKNKVNCNVKYETLHGKNKAKALLEYCQSLHADLLVVHPGTETYISWARKHISDALPADSNTQVLAVLED